MNTVRFEYRNILTDQAEINDSISKDNEIVVNYSPQKSVAPRVPVNWETEKNEKKRKETERKKNEKKTKRKAMKRNEKKNETQKNENTIVRKETKQKKKKRKKT